MSRKVPGRAADGLTSAEPGMLIALVLLYMTNKSGSDA
jgi:hypothetical protein